MLKIKKMQNFYGIKSLKVNCEFGKMNVIFSPNGTFKTSFFNGFEKIKEQKESEILDRLNNKNGKYDIEYKGEAIKYSDIITFNNNILNNINDFDIFHIEMNKKVIEDKEIVVNFINFFKDVSSKELFLTMAGNKVTKYLEWIDVIDSVEYVNFSKNYKNIRENGSFEKFTYDVAKKAGIFDEKTQENIKNIVITRQANLDLIRENFGISDVLTNLEFLEKFFTVGHIIKIKKLNNEFVEINSYDEFIKLFEKEKESIDASITIDNMDYKKLEATLSNNKVNRDVKESLLKEISLLELFQYEELYYFLFEIEEQLAKFNKEKIADAYNDLKDTLDHYDTDFFVESMEKFNQRFFSHFELLLQENHDEDLGFIIPKVVCRLHGVETSADKMITVMSKGERNACSLFMLLHQIEKVKDTNKLLLIDDEMEVFDYAYKHSFIEYLTDINNTNLNIIILSHNYDFLRSISSRIFDCNKMIAYKDDSQNITLNKIKNFSPLNKKILNNVKENQMLIALAAKRNIMELSGENINDITNFFHLKEDTTALKVSDFGRFLELDASVTNREEEYLGWVYRKANRISIDHSGSSNFLLEEKVILACATRLKFEQFFKNGEYSTNQTRRIFDKLDPQIQKEFFEINIIIPDFIHLNSFAYEPLMDIKIDRMINLYNKLLNYEEFQRN